MSDRNTNKKMQESTDKMDAQDNRNQSWGARNAASIVGGGVFVLLALVTLVMYVANN